MYAELIDDLGVTLPRGRVVEVLHPVRVGDLEYAVVRLVVDVAVPLGQLVPLGERAKRRVAVDGWTRTAILGG